MAGKKIIAVFGATGAQGGSVVQIFLNDPKLKDEWAVRAITRDASKESAKKLESQGAEVVSADLNEKATLVSAIKDASAVFAVTNYWEKLDAKLEIQQGRNLVDAAKETGVQHFIWSTLYDVNKLTNGRLAKVYHFDSKAAVAEYAKEVGIPSTFFMPGLYMSNFPGNMIRQLPPNNEWALLFPGSSSAVFPMFDTVDTGKFVKAIVLHRDELLGKDFYGATSYLTGEQVLAAFKQAYPEAGKTAKFVQMPQDQYITTLKGVGLPEFAAEELLENMLLLENPGYYGGADLAVSHKYVDDKPTTWEEYMKKSEAFKDLK